MTCRQSNITSTKFDVCLFATLIDYVSHVGKCLYWLMNTVAQQEFIEGKTFASVNIVFLDQNVECGYSLEPPQLGGSMQCLQCMIGT